MSSSTSLHTPLRPLTHPVHPPLTSPYRCDVLFDMPFSGVCARLLPRFPALRQLAPFRLGLITGPSGAAKSALLRQHFGRPRAPIAT